MTTSKELEKTINVSFCKPLAEVFKRIENGGLAPEKLALTLQSLLEDKPLYETSLAGKAIDTCENVKITETFLSQRMWYRGQEMKRHRNGGGWVPAKQDKDDESKPYVAESAYVGPFAMVFGNARVFDNAWVSDNACIFDNAWVSDNACIYGNTCVFGSARVYGNARVFDNAYVYGDAQICEGTFSEGNIK